MIDVHIHVIPDVDDGPDTIEESLQMLRAASEQGVTAVIATPHSSAYDYGHKKVIKEFARLRQAVSDQGIPVQVGIGCEILCYESDMDEIIHLLGNGTYPTMNGTRYVLAEFFPNVARKAVIYCLHRLQEAGYIPIIAHAERYQNVDIETARRLHEEGIPIQVNVYSVKKESYARIRDQVRGLLANRLVDFVGSDAHGVKRRPPLYTSGVEYMYRTYDRSYIDSILQGNPQSLLYS
jgi:protein-tyrosine phosphatase